MVGIHQLTPKGSTILGGGHTSLMGGSVSAGGGGGGPVLASLPLTPRATIFADYLLVHDLTDDTRIMDRLPTSTTSFASLIKMLTAIVVVDAKTGLLDSETVTYVAADDDDPGNFEFPLHQDGDVMTLRTALTCMIMESGNNTARMLSRHVGTGGSTVAKRADFLADMQTKIAGSAIPTLTVSDEAGTGVGSPVDALELMKLLRTYPDLKAAAETVTYSMVITGANARTDTCNHTFPLHPCKSFGTAKTGYAIDNRHSVAVWNADNGNELMIVIMKSDEGSPTINTGTRYADTIRAITQIQTEATGHGYGGNYSTGLVDNGTATQWRIAILSAGSGEIYNGFSEMLMFADGDGGEPLVFDTLTPDSERGGFEASNLLDVNETTEWSGAQYPPLPIHLTMTNATAVKITGLRLRARTDFANQAPVDFDVQYHDGSEWVTSWSVRDVVPFTAGEAKLFRAPFAADYTPDAHRYWRVRNLAGGNASGFYSINELELFDTPAGADIAGDGTPIFSQERVGFEASKAFDGLVGTVWSPNQNPSDPIYLGVDFGVSPVEILRVAMTSRNDAGLAVQQIRKFALDYSDDGSTWVEAWRLTDAQSNYGAAERREHAADYHDIV